jgi:hypothetical protein
MTDIGSVIMFSGLERLLTIITGLASIYFGYKLFSVAIDNTGRLEGEWLKWKLKLHNIAPGVFFAIFGSAIIIASVIHPFTFNDGNVLISGMNAASSSLDNRNEDATINSTMINSITTIVNTLKPQELNQSHDDKVKIMTAISNLVGYRNVLVDKIYGDGSASWYLSKYDSISKGEIKYEKLTSSDKERYDSLKIMYNPDK